MYVGGFLTFINTSKLFWVSVGHFEWVLSKGKFCSIIGPFCPFMEVSGLISVSLCWPELCFWILKQRELWLLLKANYPHLISADRLTEDLLTHSGSQRSWWSSAAIDAPVYYPTLSSQYVSHEYAIAPIDGLVSGFMAQTAKALSHRPDSLTRKAV